MKASQGMPFKAVTFVPFLAPTSLFTLLVVLLSFSGHVALTLPIEHKAKYGPSADARTPQGLHVKGNQIVDSDGSPVLLRGLMPPDPARLRDENRFGKDLILSIADTGANVVRIPIHPANWVMDADYLWRYLDPVVTWASEAGIYVILDWHYIGNVSTGAGSQMPHTANGPMELTLRFWRLIAAYFGDAPNTIFEIFNEPADISAEEWYSSATDIIGAIREQGARQLVIVGGIDYGKDLSWVVDHPIRDENVGYASHIYPSHPRSLWQYWFGRVSEQFPVLATEWGFLGENRVSSAPYLAGDKNTYGEPFLAYLATKRIGWVACWFDDRWLPPMFTPDRKGYTRYGQFVIEQLETN